MSLIIVNFRKFIVFTSSIVEKIKKPFRDLWMLNVIGSHYLFFPAASRAFRHNLENFINSLLQIFTLHWEYGLEGTKGEGNPFNRFWISAIHLHEDWHKGSTIKEKPWEWLRLLRFLTWEGESPWFSGKKILFLKMVQDQMLGRNLKCQTSNTSGGGFNSGSW